MYTLHGTLQYAELHLEASLDGEHIFSAFPLLFFPSKVTHLMFLPIQFNTCHSTI